jgi:hypothetical protein
MGLHTVNYVGVTSPSSVIACWEENQVSNTSLAIPQTTGAEAVQASYDAIEASEDTKLTSAASGVTRPYGGVHFYQPLAVANYGDGSLLTLTWYWEGFARGGNGIDGWVYTGSAWYYDPYMGGTWYKLEDFTHTVDTLKSWVFNVGGGYSASDLARLGSNGFFYIICNSQYQTGPPRVQQSQVLTDYCYFEYTSVDPMIGARIINII